MTDNYGCDDPLYRHALREAWVILSVWSVCLLYTCTYCYLNGYLEHPAPADATGPTLGGLLGPSTTFDRDPSTLTTPLGLGIPDWVFFGVVVPWLGCIVVTIWLCLYFFSEDPLDAGDAGEDSGA